MSNFDARFIKFLTILLVLGLVSGLSACQPARNDQFTATEKTNAVLGGFAIEANSLFAARVIYLALGVERKTTPFGFTLSQQGICTASAISTRVLLTAAHCVKGLAKEKLYAVMTINPWNHPLNMDEWISVDNIKVHENYIPQDPVSLQSSNDLALIHLTKDIDASRVSALADATQTKDNPMDLVAVGYGKTSALINPKPGDDANDPAHMKDQSTLLHYVMKSVTGFNPSNKLFAVDQGDLKGICQGDSGGPGFIWDKSKQQFFILGVTSFVSIFSDEKQQRDPQNKFTPCIGRANYTNLLAYKDWLTHSLAEISL